MDGDSVLRFGDQQRQRPADYQPVTPYPQRHQRRRHAGRRAVCVRDAINQNDSTPADAAYTISEPTTLSLGQSNSLRAWSLTESFCARARQQRYDT